MSAQITGAIGDLFEAVTNECHVVLCIDDIDNIDPSSMELLGRIAGIHDLRLLVVAAAKSKDIILPLADAIPETDREYLQLRPLSIDGVRQFLGELKQQHSSPTNEEDVRWHLALSGGNPLRLMLFGRNTFTGARDNSAVQTVASVLARRLDQLSETALLLLQACAVLGPLCSLGRLSTLIDMSAPRLLQCIRELEQAALLSHQSAHLAPAHDLICEEVLRRIGTTALRALHFTAATILEAEARESSDPAILWECAEHWSKAAEDARAASAIKQCAHQALEIGEPTAAVSLLRQALRRSLPKQLRQALLTDCVRAADICADWSTAADVITENVELAHQSPGSRHSDYELLEISVLWRAGFNIEDRRRQLLRCLAIKTDTDHCIRAAGLLLMLAERCYSRQLADRAYEVLLASEQFGHISPEQSALHHLVYHASFGHMSDALAKAVALATFGSSEPDSARACPLLHNAGLGLFRVGELTRSGEVLRECYTRAARHRIRTYEVLSSSLLARASLTAGDVAEASKWHAVATAAYEKGRKMGAAPLHFSNGFDLALLRADVSEAERWLEHSRDTFGAISSGRPRITYVAYSLLLAKARGERLEPSEHGDELLREHESASTCGLYDSAMLALYHYLADTHRSKLAAELLTGYVLRGRRDGYPLDAALLQFSQRHP